MNPKLMVINTIDKLKELKSIIYDAPYIAYDIETTGLTRSHEIVGFSICVDEAEAYYVIMAEWNKEQQRLSYPEDDYKMAVLELIHMLPTRNLICHNAIFDASMTEAFFKVRIIDSIHTDTMVLAHLLDENRRVGLKELATQYFGVSHTQEAKEMQASVLANGGLWTAKNKEMYKADSNILGKYGAKDALLTYKLFMTLVPELYEQNLDKFFYEEESMPMLRGPTYELNTMGLTVDTTALTQLKKTLEAECLEAKDFIHKEIQAHVKDKYPGSKKSNTFNIGSSGQLSWLLFGQLGLEFGTLTKGGKNIAKQLNVKVYTPAGKHAFIQECLSNVGQVYELEAIVNGKKKSAKKYREPWAYIACDKATLKKLSHKYKWIEKLLEYQRKTKLLNTYVEGIEERIHYGVVTSSYLQHGTTTGRYASRNPNLQNLPREDKRVKGCFVARPGKVFVSADFSQLEPRVFSYYSQDPRLMAAFDGTTDFYSVVGQEVYDKYDCTPQKDGSPDAFGVKYKQLRDLSKVIALASAYGATANQLAPTTGKSIDDTKEDMEKYFERFPGVRKMMLEAHDIAKEKGEVTNLFGRVRRIPEAKQIVKLYGNSEHWDLPYDARKLLNMACNFRIQSTGGSIMNRAGIRLYNDFKNLGINCKFVSQIHDEWVLECDEKDAENVALLLQNAMETTNQLKGVALEAIPRITKNLAK